MDPTIIAAGIMGAGSLASSALNVFEQERTNDSSIELANTAHQREVKDLRAAGLNPILSANRGAPVPQQTAPRVDNPATSALDALTAKSSIALQGAQANSALAAAEQTKAQTQGVNIDNAYKQASNALNLEILRNQVQTSNLGPLEKQRQIAAIDASIAQMKAQTSLTGWSAKDIQDKLKYGNLKGEIEPLRSLFNSAKGLHFTMPGLDTSSESPMMNHLEQAIKSGRIVPRGGGK